MSRSDLHPCRPRRGRRGRQGRVSRHRPLPRHPPTLHHPPPWHKYGPATHFIQSRNLWQGNLLPPTLSLLWIKTSHTSHELFSPVAPKRNIRITKDEKNKQEDYDDFSKRRSQSKDKSKFFTTTTTRHQTNGHTRIHAHRTRATSTRRLVHKSVCDVLFWVLLYHFCLRVQNFLWC